MKGILKPLDYENHKSSDKQIRWRNSAQWARNTMVNDDGRMKKKPQRHLGDFRQGPQVAGPAASTRMNHPKLLRILAVNERGYPAASPQFFPNDNHSLTYEDFDLTASFHLPSLGCLRKPWRGPNISRHLPSFSQQRGRRVR